MRDEDETSKAARRSRDWKARQAEIAAARASDAEDARRVRNAAEREQREDYQNGGWAQLALPLALAFLALLFWQRQTMEQRVADCLEGPKRPNNYNCANLIAESFWSWLIPSDMAEQLHTAQREFNR